MSLGIALDSALSGLRATQAQLQVISGNIANAQTPGYSEETISQSAQVTGDGGTGVITGEVQRATDKLLQTSVLGQTAVSGNANALSSYYQQVQNLIGQVGSGSSLSDALNTFLTAMQTVATTPQDPNAQSNAVNAGSQLASQLNGVSSGIQSLRENADSQINTDVGIVNGALTSIANLNTQIAQLQAQSQPTATLADQRDQLLAQIGTYVPVTSFTHADGTMTVMTTTGQTLVDAGTAQQFGYTPAGNITAATALSPLTIAGANVTSDVSGGEIGALLQMGNTTLPGLTQQLNAFTNNLFSATTDGDLQTTNSGTNATNDAAHFFANVNIAGGKDNAATIEVNPSLAAAPALLYNGSGGPDPTIAETLSGNLGNAVSFAAAGGLAAMTTTLGNYVAQVVGQQATAASNASANATDQSSLLNQMQSQYESATGVSLDTELSNLITYQNAYGASARVITTIQTMFDTLMKM